MARQWLHCIDQDGLHVFATGQGGLRPAGSFEATDEGQARFRQWLHDNRIDGLHCVLADLADEGFHSESVPWVLGQDRRALLRRRMTQHFFGTPYVTALSLGRETTGRRDERIVFTALTRPAAIEPWLAIMREHPLALSSLRTPALLLRQLLGGIKPDVARGLVLTLSHTGIRQLYFDEGRLRFARLAPAPEGPFARWAPDCLREAQKTYQYLSAQRWQPRGSELPVWVLLHQEDIDPFMRELPSGDALHFRAVNAAEVIQRLGLRLQLASSDCRPLFMHLSLRESGGTQLAPESDRRFYRRWQIRSAALAIGAVCFAACAVLALKLQVDSLALRDEVTQHRSEEAQFSAQYQQILQSLPNTPDDLSQLNRVIDAYEQLIARPVGPHEAMITLSKTMTRFPEVELIRLEWEAQGKLLASQTSTDPLPQALTVTARLPAAANADPRSALARIRAFASDLQERAGGQVTLTRQPFDVEADKILRSALNPGEPEFELRWQVPGGGA